MARAFTSIQRAAWLVSCLPESEAEQLLQRLPAMKAAHLRHCGAAAVPGEDERIGILERFIVECAGPGSNGG